MATAQQLTSFVSQSAEFEECRRNVYPPLDHSRRGIRLMTIHPGKFNDHVQITLERASLDDSPSYEAVSYTWEDLTQTRIVELDGHEYIITKNQFEAVQHFRWEDVTRVLWMDVFCIDQADLAEKSRQVSMMGEIYAGAITTLIWLGKFNEDWVGTIDSMQLDKAAELLKNEADLPRIPGDESRLAVSPHLSGFNNIARGENGRLLAAAYVLLLLAESHHLLQMPIYSVDDQGNAYPNSDWYKAVETLRLILDRPWWERAWVIQEVAWSKQPPMVHMGGLRIPLKMFCSAAAALNNHVVNSGSCCTSKFEVWSGRPTTDTQALITKVGLLFTFHIILEELPVGQMSFKDAVSFSNNTKVTDPRDIIYSVLSLVRKDQRVHVDYNHTVAETYTLSSWTSIRLADSLNGLGEAGSKNNSNNWQLPSWVRDWSKTPICKPLADWIHNTKTYTVLPDWDRTVLDTSDGSLTLPSVTLGTVEACFPSMAAPGKMFNVLVKHWLQQLRESGYEFELAALIKTVFKNTGVNTDSPLKPGDVENLIAVYQQYSEPGRFTEPGPQGFLLHDLQTTFVVSTLQTGLFVTEQEKLGIAHKDIKPGDVLCHVRGCSVPLAIRKLEPSGHSGFASTAEDIERFAMVDACYINGSMDLENAHVDWNQAKDIKLV